MSRFSAKLARNITWQGSKQTFYTAYLLVDKNLINDFFRAYGYFRWIDDIIDTSSIHAQEMLLFVERQRRVIHNLYSNQISEDLLPEEEMIADLIKHDKRNNSGLQSFVRNMFAIIEFDAYRKMRLITEKELHWYINTLSKSVTDGIFYFIGNDIKIPIVGNQYAAVKGSHITHLLRDMVRDIQDGFINIPIEYLKTNKISDIDFNDPLIKLWVKSQVELARDYFQSGKQYLSRLKTLRRKIAGYWYCARFECILDAIELDDYCLRLNYGEHQRKSNWLNMALLAIITSTQHLVTHVTHWIGG